MTPKHYFLSILYLILFTPICIGQTIQQDKKYIQQRDSLFVEAAPYFNELDISHINWEKPISSLKEAKQMTIEANDQEYYLYALSYLIYLYEKSEQYDLMKLTLKEAETQHNSFKIDDKDFAFYANKDFMWGEYHYVMGDLAAAITAYQESIKKYVQGFSLDFEVSAVYNNIGLAFEKSGDYEKAIYHYEFALINIPKSKNSINKAIHIQNIAKAYFHWGKFTQALSHYHKALQLLKNEEADDLKTSIYRNLSTYYSSQNQQDSALIFINKAINLISYNVQGISTYIERAKIYTQQKNYPSALQDLDTAFNLAQKQYSNIKHPKIGEIYLLQGKIAIKQKKYQKALSAFQQALIALNYDFNDSNLTALPSLKQVSSSRTLLKVLQQQAKTWQQAGELKNALATYQKATELLDYMRLQQLESTSAKYLLLEQAKTIYEEAITVALALDDSLSAFAFSQKAHGLLLTQNLMDRSARKFAGIPDSLLEQERMLQHQISSKERAISTQQKESGQDTTLFHLKEEYRNFLQQLEQDYPVYYEYKYHIPTADVATIQAKLSYRTALLEYFVGQDSIYTFLITTRDIQVFTHPKTSNFIEQIKAIQQSVIQFSSNEQYYQRYSQAAYQLYQQLVEPAVKALPFYVNELVIIADEQLHYIPFQILLSTPPKAAMRYDLLDYLVKDYFISYQYSSALFSDDLHITPQKKRQTLVGFAPTFDGSPIGPRGEKLSNLLHTKKEVQEIHKVITDGQIYLDSTATATVFKQKVNSSKIAHIASHASSDDIPFGNYIYFADTTVSPTEIYNLPMNLDLVVLSACETAQGKLQKGEGIIGWTQAFLYAGCPSVVASLWRVNDAVTATLMVDFYKSLFAGNTKNVALATAQRNYLHKTTASLEAHPYYWAAFIQIGNTEAVFDQGWDWRLIAGLGLLLLIGLWWVRQRF